jgi:hypothetical protein
MKKTLFFALLLMCSALNSAIKAEYVFILLGVVAIAVAIMLLRSSRKHPELKLDEPAS